MKKVESEVRNEIDKKNVFRNTETYKRKHFRKGFRHNASLEYDASVEYRRSCYKCVYKHLKWNCGLGREYKSGRESE